MTAIDPVKLFSCSDLAHALPPRCRLQPTVRRLRAAALVAGREPLRDDDRGHAHPEHQLAKRGAGDRQFREADLLEPHALYAVPVEELEELLRPAGYFRVKARRLRSLLQFLIERYRGSLDAMFQTELPDLRRELLEVHGIGPETADSILLYAGHLPSFVVDAYTHRVFARHGWIRF